MKDLRFYIDKFIKENGLTFEEGRRNSDCVVICGYGLYKWKTNPPLKYLNITLEEILEDCLKSKLEKDEELQKEFDKVFDFAVKNNYGKWWEKEENRNQYV